MPLRNLPIQRKLMLVILAACCVEVVVMCAAFTTYEVVTIRRGMVRGMTTRAEIIAANTSAAVAFQNEADATDVLGALKKDPQIVAAGIYDGNGHLFARYPSNAPAETFPASAEGPAHHFEPSYLVIRRPIVQGDRALGTVYLQTDLSALHDRLRVYVLLGFLVVAGSVLAAYLVSRFLQRQISGPILALAGTARAISERKDYSVRAEKMGEDEVGLLTDAFNQMLAQIHELNQEQEQRVEERTAQLAEANQELEAFSYSVSHDLRAPLRHIDGFADMLRKESKGNLNAAGERYLNIIAEAARRMGALIDDLLIFSRMGRAEMRRTRVNTDELVAEVMKEMAPDMQGRKIAWDIGRLPEVQGDRAMLKQVWFNLLSNAVKYSGHREEARIGIRGQKNGQGEWEFSVRDNGAGFDMQYADKLFGVFQRLHQAEEFEGTGIGLANVRRVVLRHGGRVWAEGKLDVGATFCFTLPEKEKKVS